MGLFDFLTGARAAKEEANEQIKKARKIMSKVVNIQLTRFGIQIDEWKTGIDSWEDVNTPTTVELIRVYNDLALDPHLTAAMETRKARTLSKEYKIVSENGEELDEETSLFNTVWFRDYLKFCLDSRFFGYSVIQFGNRVGKSFDYIKLVPREYVYPQKQAIRKNPYSTEDLIPLKSGKFAAWTQYVGKRGDDLGLLAKAAPMMIYKKTTQGAWAEFGELFGAPFRLGKTDIRNDELRENMYFMLENMGRNAYGVFSHDDELEFIGDKKTDAYEVYDKLIERANSEISKLILGSTMVMDDGSSQSQAEVHERTLEAIDKDDSLFIQEVVNNELIPWLNQYHNFGITGVWKWDDAERITKDEQFKRDVELIKTGKYKVPAEYITETYGIPLEEVEEIIDKGPKGKGQDDDEDNDDPNNPGGGKGPKPGDLNNSLESKKKALSLEAEHICDVCNQVDSSDIPPVEWDDLTVTDVVNGVYSGKYTVENLPESVYFRIAKELTDGMDRGILAVGDAADTFDRDFIRSLKNNAFQFSGAKTFQQVREMSDFIADNQGRRVPFSEYEAKATELFNTYNRNWLRTEIAQAENSATMASKWQEFEKDAEFLPFLKYDTVGDERVREDHKALDGITRPINDPFWDTYYPPNGWRCRCDVQQEDEDATPTKLGGIGLPEVPPSMQINVGKQKVLFGPEHPYFIVENQFKELKGNNFNLPIPDEAVTVRTEDVTKELEGFKGKWRHGSLTGRALEQQKEFEKFTGKEIPDVLFKNFNNNVTIDKTIADGQYQPFNMQIRFGKGTRRWSRGDYYKTKVIAHEMAHGIHFQKNIVNYGKHMSDDFKELYDFAKNEFKEISGGKYGEYLYKIENEYLIDRDRTNSDDAEKWGSLLDTFGDITKGRYGSGHTKAYYKDLPGMELFAHLSENYFVGNKYFKKYLPETYKKGIEYFDKILNNG